MRNYFYTDELRRYDFCNIVAILLLLVLSACGSTPEVTKSNDNENKESWSINRVVHSEKGMVSLLDPFDLSHHQADPVNWFMHDFAIQDDLETGRSAAVLTDRPGTYNVRVTFGELTKAEQLVAGPQARLRLRVINRRLLLSGGDTWPSVEANPQSFAYDQSWINIPNADYGVVITALDPTASQADYVFQLFRVDDMKNIKYAPALPQLVYGQSPAVVGLNAKGVQYHERCADIPDKANWVPLISSTMPIPGAVQTVELPRSLHATALARQQSGSYAAMPVVLARSPQVGSYGFFIKPDTWSEDQLQSQNQAMVKTLIRCAVRISNVEITPDDFQLQLEAIPTAIDRVSQGEKTDLINGFQAWMKHTNDMAWHVKSEMVKRSDSDAAMVLGILEYLNLSAKESEDLLPMSNALRVDYLLDRIDGFTNTNSRQQ